MIAGGAKLIAILLACAVLSGAQCLNICAISPCGGVEQSAAPAGNSTCHHNSDSPTTIQSCSHQELVTGNRVGEFSPDADLLSAALTRLVPEVIPEPSGLLPSRDSLASFRVKHRTTPVLRI